MGDTEMIRTVLHPPDHDGSRRRAACLLALLTCLLAGMNRLAYAEESPTVSSDPHDRTQFLSVLDGQAFKGEISEDNEPAFGDDVWIFEEGIFVSKACHECEKAEYWLRSENDGIRFHAKTVCPDADAAVVYTGLVNDDRIEGTFTWTIDRWYGDIEKKFRFEGERIENAELAASQSSSSVGSCSEMPHQRPSAPQQVLPSIRDDFLRFP